MLLPRPLQEVLTATLDLEDVRSCRAETSSRNLAVSASASLRVRLPSPGTRPRRWPGRCGSGEAAGSWGCGGAQGPRDPFPAT